MLVKPISETRNVNDVFMPIWFIHSRITNLQRIQCKKGIILNVQNLQRKIKLRQINPRLGLLRMSILILIIQITANFALALTSEPITYCPFKFLEKPFGFQIFG